MTITLESIKTAHEKVAEMIAKFEKQPPQFAPCSVHQPLLKEGERWLGAIISADGAKRHHVILLPGEIDDTNWKDSMAWAASIGGDLPNRCETALLFATMKDEFKEEAYWTNEQHAAYSGYAWYQSFNYGFQHNSNKSAELRARAVRRLAIL